MWRSSGRRPAGSACGTRSLDRRHVQPHVAALGAAAVGMYAAVRRRRLSPLLIGGAAAFTLATAAHPLFEGNTPQNLGRPLWAARGFLRLCVRTVTGRISAEVADLPAADSAT